MAILANINGVMSGNLASVDGVAKANIETIDGVTASSEFLSATGGVITENGDYKVHTFETGGDFTVSAVGTDATYGDVVRYLIVGGGASAAIQSGGYGAVGAGGAGGYRVTTSDGYVHTVTAQVYAIAVGDGGASISGGSGVYDGAQGSASSFDGESASGGGKSNYQDSTTNANERGNGTTGGSGGGGSGSSGVGAAGNSGSFSPSEGSAGGSGTAYANSNAGGGGGSSAVGSDGPPGAGGVGGSGGDGTSNDIKIAGTGVYYAGGGAVDVIIPWERERRRGLGVAVVERIPKTVTVVMLLTGWEAEAAAGAGG